MPTVSVIIPLHNGERYIKEAIASVLCQTWQDFELIVVDDGSTDRGKEVALSLKTPIRYFHQENSGVCAARNLGIQKSKGKYIAFLDQDDRWYPHKLERQVPILEGTPETGIVYSDVDLIDENGDLIEPASLSRQPPLPIADESLNIIFRLYPRPHPFPSTVLARRELIIQIGMFDAAFQRNSYEDKELWFRIAKQRHSRFFFCAEALTQRRCHSLQGERDPDRRDENWLVYLERLSRLFMDELKDVGVRRKFIEWALAESSAAVFDEVEELYEADLKRDSQLRRRVGKVLSRKGRNLIRSGEVCQGRRFLKKAFVYYPLYWKNLLRFTRLFLAAWFLAISELVMRLFVF